MTTKANSQENRGTFKELRTLTTGQAVAYALPNAGVNAVLGILVNFTIIYYVNIMGVPPIIVGGLFSLAMYIYAFMCPVFGAICDKFETRFGRKKTIMLISALPYVIFFLVLYMNPVPPADVEFGSIYLPIVLWLAVFLIGFRIVSSAFFSSYTSLLPELSTDEQNRIKVATINMMIVIIGVAMGLLGPMIVLGETTEGLSRENPELYYPISETGQAIRSGILVFALIMAFFFLVAFIIMMVTIKEPQINACEASVTEMFIDLMEPFKDKNCRTFLISYFLLWIPLVSLSYVLMNVITYILALRGSEYFIFAGVAFTAAIISFLVWNGLSAKLGLKKTTSICLLIAIAGFLLVMPLALDLPHEIVIIYGFTIVCILLLGFVGSQIFPWAILSDIIDSAEIRTGRSLSGPYSGAYNFVLSSAAATSMLIISIVLEIFGPTEKISYALVFMLGSILLAIAVFIFQKVKIVGTDQRQRE